MNDPHEFIDEKGVKYLRLFVNPNASIDTRVDPWSKKDWMKRTNKRMTVGEMMDESAQLSAKREKQSGVDPIKQKVFSDYEKKTGKKHPDNKPNRIETKDLIVEL